MANEGIMSLPQGLDMQGAPSAQTQAPTTVSSLDSYDAASTALGNLDPQAQEAAKQAVREAIGDLQLTPEQIDLMIQVFEYVSNNPTEYKNLVQTLIQEGIADPGDFPEEYDPQFIGLVLMVLNEMRMMQGQGAMEPMQMGPAMEGMEPMGFAEGGLADVASYLAAQGRNGDSMLAHITPEEAEMLKARGGSGTINPVTGLPEFFLKKIFKAVKSVVKSVVNVVKKAMQSPIGKILGTIALATVLGPAGIGLQLGSTAAASAAINMGLASAGTTLLGGGNLKQALIAGATGYFGAGGTLGGINPISAAGQYLPGAAGSALNTGLSTGLVTAGIGKVAGLSTEEALKMGLTSGASAAAMQGLQNTRAGQTPTPGGDTSQGIGGIKAAQDMVGTGSPGQIGTAQDMLGGGLRPAGSPPAAMSYDPMTGSFKADYSIAPPSAPGGGNPGFDLSGTAGAMTGRGMDGTGTGLSMPAGVSSRDISVAAGGTSPATNYSLMPTPPSPMASQPTGLIDRAISGAKDIYNEYLSPSRPGLPSDAGLLRKYGPLMAAGTAVAGATGMMDQKPAEANPLFDKSYTGMDYLRDNPDRFQGGLDFSYRRPDTPQNPVVQTDFSRSIPIGQPGQIMPMGATMSPGGVAQPYNVSGLYGVPLIYPVGRAKGGEMTMTEFPRKTGPINGPGTGTSDSIPAMLSDGEFVFTARAVRNAGGGSRRKGAARMYKLMKKLEGGPVKG